MESSSSRRRHPPTVRTFAICLLTIVVFGFPFWNIYVSTTKMVRWNEDLYNENDGHQMPPHELIGSPIQQQQQKNSTAPSPSTPSPQTAQTSNDMNDIRSSSSSSTYSCPDMEQFWYLRDQNASTTSRHKKIPPILYQTSKGPCITKTMYQLTIHPWLHGIDNENSSSFELSYRFFDDDRMNAYLYHHPKYGNWSTIFPGLPYALQCIDHVGTMPVMKADLWRYLILWERGGFFADLDVVPGKSKEEPNNNTTPSSIHEHYQTHDDDAFFVHVPVAKKDLLSQWFLAAAPQHPLLYYAVEEATYRILSAKRTIPIQHTGPNVLYAATDRFLEHSGGSAVSHHLQVNQVYTELAPPNKTNTTSEYSNQRRSFRLLSSDWAANEAFKEEKGRAYQLMNMTHYMDVQRNRVKLPNGNNNNHTKKKGSKKAYDGKNCLEFLGGKLIPKVDASSAGRGFVLGETTFSFRNPMPTPE